ncbi:MAG: hypothetical protein QOJ79_2277 [Actinomycetota bacterium]|jgi:hypothetical protein|nr:hypothetical protein [Actinomycetota bacterium]
MSRASALATAVLGAALLATAPGPAAAVRTLATATATPAPLAPLLALVSLGAWSLLVWLLLVALATEGSRLPGLAGQVAGGLTRRIAPAGVRRFVEVALGLTVAVGALGAAPASAGTHVPPAPAAAAASLNWPTPPAGPRPTAPTLDWNPASAHPAVTHPTVATPTVANPTAVVVEPGDSLWRIAAHHLAADASTAQIAQAWPSWWSANRGAIGSDPDLIHPGLSLTPPAQH